MSWNQITEIQNEAEKAFKEALSSQQLYEHKVKYLGKNGKLTDLMKLMATLSKEEKPKFGQAINQSKQALEALYVEVEVKIRQREIHDKMINEEIDLTLPSVPIAVGHPHPIFKVTDEIVQILARLGYSLRTGPLIEKDHYNFEALNIPKDHPARDMQDTFYFKDGSLLRTHTSPVQIRTMLETKPPIRMIAPGSVFRRDYDITHTPMFHQVEGLVVDDKGKVSFANLKSILTDFLQYMFGDVEVRFRPSFFPFTEPSAEVDISCIFCEGEGCRVCSHTGWLEVLGCGIVDPNVFKAVGYEEVSGYAFGLGVERFAMLMHKIPDLRSLFEGDIRLLEQFR